MPPIQTLFLENSYNINDTVAIEMGTTMSAFDQMDYLYSSIPNIQLRFRFLLYNV